MKLAKLWMLATILTFCGLCLLTSCGEEDNPVVVPTGPGAELRSKLQTLATSMAIRLLMWMPSARRCPTLV